MARETEGAGRGRETAWCRQFVVTDDGVSHDIIGDQGEEDGPERQRGGEGPGDASLVI